MKGEIIQLHHLRHEGKETAVRIKSEEDLTKSRFGSEPKTKVIADVLSQRGQTRQISFIERPMVVFEGTTPLEEKWKFCKEAGLPVAPTIRRTDRGTVVFGNLTANGSEFYGKSMYERFIMRKYRRNEDISEYIKLMPQFLHILEDDQDKLRLQLENALELANNNNIYLSPEDPFDLRVNPDGSWDIFMLDLFSVEKMDDNYPRDQLVEENSQAKDEFLKELSHIKKLYNKFRSEKSK